MQDKHFGVIWGLHGGSWGHCAHSQSKGGCFNPRTWLSGWGTPQQQSPFQPCSLALAFLGLQIFTSQCQISVLSAFPRR